MWIVRLRLCHQTICAEIHRSVCASFAMPTCTDNWFFRAKITLKSEKIQCQNSTFKFQRLPYIRHVHLIPVPLSRLSLCLSECGEITSKFAYLPVCLPSCCLHSHYLRPQQLSAHPHNYSVWYLLTCIRGDTNSDPMMHQFRRPPLCWRAHNWPEKMLSACQCVTVSPILTIVFAGFLVFVPALACQPNGVFWKTSAIDWPPVLSFDCQVLVQFWQIVASQWLRVDTRWEALQVVAVLRMSIIDWRFPVSIDRICDPVP